MENRPAKMCNIKVNLPGGIVSVGDFMDILHAAEKAAIESVQFGNRQQLYLAVNEEKLEDLEHHFHVTDTEFEMDADDYPNIISSYVTEDIFDSSVWLREGVYRDILDSFHYPPRLKINLVDSSQTLVPFFTGNLNFISADISNYWYLYIRFPKTNIIHCWSSLIYSEDISALSKQIENIILSNRDSFYDQEIIEGKLLEKQVNAAGNFFFQPLSTPLKVPDFQLPYYEGFNKYHDKYWLGIYRRNEQFTVAFLKDICAICTKTRIGQIYTTPWKSMIIKGVEAADRKLWNLILGKHRINVRHASSELNWQTEDLSVYGLELKHELIKEFDKVDLRTFKLCFAVKTNPKTGLFGAVIIRKQPESGDNAEVFDVLHTIDFNPNSKNFILYKENIQKNTLSEELIQLCDQYYHQQTSGEIHAPDHYFVDDNVRTAEEPAICFQCTHCLSIYDEELGDELNDINPGTLFSALENTYYCPVCQSGKTDFIAIDRKILITL